MPQLIWKALGVAVLASVPFSCATIAQNTSLSTPASSTDTKGVFTALRAAVQPLSGKDDDYNALMTQIGNARVVMLGESTHGTQEFYRERMRITQRLIREKGFSAVVIEGDWPDAYRVNQYVRGQGRDASAEGVLSSFTRFPRWMWRNTVVRDLTEWMRRHNASLPPGTTRAGFYGMDLYSLPRSSDAVVQHLQALDAPAATRARTRYGGFAAFRTQPERYGVAALTDASASQERAAREQFEELQRAYNAAQSRKDEWFSALQNARVVKNAEEYYRVSYRGGESSWNLRDRHMADTLDALLAHLGTPSKPAKVVVWAHNSHVGDARYTSMGESGELNVGQLMRQRHPSSTFLLGFTTYSGTAMAATEWDAPGQVQRVRPALPGSFGALFHDTGVKNFLLPLRGKNELVLSKSEPRLERAIGVVYLPQTERQSHYFEARMSKQFDAVIHLDLTNAVTPLRP
ncbi:MAG: erythromycin esterase family protein [Armatimonadetes bacterium]|nr:erythromycin esterase family protein [Armatimonadota bacterium]